MKKENEENEENKQCPNIIIKDVRQKKCEYGVRSSLSPKRVKMIFTIVTIVYNDKKRKSLESSLSGELVGYGPDYFIMQADGQYSVYDENAQELTKMPVGSGELCNCKGDGFWLNKPDGVIHAFNRMGDELGVVQIKSYLQPKQNEDNLIRKFWLRSPNAMTGMFWIHYTRGKNIMVQYPVFLSIRDLYRLFKIEGIDPLAVDEDDDQGFYFATAVLENLGDYWIEVSGEEGETCITVTRVAPVEV